VRVKSQELAQFAAETVYAAGIPIEEGKAMTVEVYSGTEAVRLYLNGKLIGEKLTGRDQAFIAEFSVPFTPGTLRAVGIRFGKAVAENTLETAGEPAGLKLTADRTVITADGQDLAFVTVEAIDEKGWLQVNAEMNVRFSVIGAATIAAVGSGDGQSQESYVGNSFNLFHGRALIVLRATRNSGQIKLLATADGMKASSIGLAAKLPPVSLSELR
jgi:beta-galactosidase